MDALRNDILSFWGLLKAYSFQKYFKNPLKKTALWWPSLKHFLAHFEGLPSLKLTVSP